MSRIAKADVNAALQTAARAIIKAGGDDGRTSRADMKEALRSMPRAQRSLADIFFKFVDRRDFKTGAQVTAKDVNRAVAYAKTHMIAKYDLNQNGLSKDEVARMSLTGKRAVDLARVLKGTVADEGPVDSRKLGQEIGTLAPKANYISESDYAPQYVSAAFPAGHDLNAHNVMTAFKDTLCGHFDQQDGDLFGPYAARVYSKADAKAFIDRLSETSPDDDAGQVESAKAFGEISALLKANLTDLQVVKVGPKDERTGKLADDHGLYAYMVVGRASDGKVAGVMIGSVET